MSEQRIARVIIGKAGGNSSKNCKTYVITIPNLWAKELEVTPDNRTMLITLTDDKKIIIEKINEEN